MNARQALTVCQSARARACSLTSARARSRAYSHASFPVRRVLIDVRSLALAESLLASRARCARSVRSRTLAPPFDSVLIDVRSLALAESLLGRDARDGALPCVLAHEL